MEKQKSCKQCHKKKPIAEFAKRKGTPDGRGYLCGRCHAGRIKAGKLRAGAAAAHAKAAQPTRKKSQVAKRVADANAALLVINHQNEDSYVKTLAQELRQFLDAQDIMITAVEVCREDNSMMITYRKTERVVF